MSETIGSIQVVATINTKDYENAKKKIEKGNSDLENNADKTSKGFSAAWVGAIAGVAAALTNKFVSAVTGSIDSAVRRVDTLNNSSRTFQNMGIDAVQASKSMTALEKSIKGLPTPLDSAVSGMTALTATYGDIDKGQKIFSALNNAILGFGGSSAMVDNAITQLSQLPMDGPLDAQTWNSLRNSGITPVLAAMAKDSGKSVAKLKEEFGDGTLTVQDFTDKLLKLNSEGGGGLVSLEKIAQDSTKGIGTGFANMQTAITRGVAKIIQSIGSENISNVITGIGNAFSFVLGFISDIITVLAQGDFKGGMFAGLFEEDSDFVNFLFTVREAVMNIIDTAKVLITGDFKHGMFGGMVEEDSEFVNTLFTIREAIGNILNFIKSNKDIIVSLGVGILSVVVAMKAWAAITKGMAIAQAALNVVMAANPIGIIITLIAALVAGLIFFFTQTETGKKIWEGFTQFLGVMMQVIIGYFKNAWNVIKSVWDFVVWYFQTVWNGIVTVFKAVDKFFGGIFSKAWDNIVKAFSLIGKFFKGVWNTITGIFTNIGTAIGNAIGGAFKNVINTILRFAIGYINGFIDAINGAIDLINNIPGVDIGKIGKLPVPQLAAGGITTGATLAMIGEGREQEAVLPLSKLDSLINTDGGGGDTYQITVNASADMIRSENDKREFATMIVDSFNQTRKANGLQPIGQ